MDTQPETIFQAGKNCWRKTHAGRISFLVDAADYYRAFYRVVSQARQSVFILGWDIDSRLKLVRDGGDYPFPVHLLDFLNAVAAKNKGLHIYVLVWDFAAIYTLEREWWPAYKFDWKTHSRVHFCFFNHLPTGASFHQKSVVVDDKLAFAGGIDLSKWRWDTSAHTADNPDRIDPDGKPYPPFHDMQMMVEGESAAALGELSRDYWKRATGKGLSLKNNVPESDLWPSEIKADIENVTIAISRTVPQYEDQNEVREIEQLLFDAIKKSKKYIYIENQYLTAHKLGEALADRLEEEHGPELVLVLPYQTGGWLEQNTMDVLRCRLIKKLQAADSYHRLRVYYPHHPELKESYISVHSKLLIVDGTLLLIGSPNFSNRSMGLDIECNLAVESCGEAHVADAVSAFQYRLLSEHLDVSPEKMARTMEREKSFIHAIESLQSRTRSLVVLKTVVSDEVDAMIPQSTLIDPECPISEKDLAAEFIEKEERRPAGTRMVLMLSLFVLLLALAGAWRWTSLGDWLNIPKLLDTLEAAKNSPFTPLWVMAGFILSGFLVIPVTLMVVTTILVFGAVKGFFYALTGAIVSAVFLYKTGQVIGSDTLQRFQGSRLTKIRRHLQRQGILTIIITRMLPIAPFSILNLVAGASRIGLRNFTLGTLLGMTPGILAHAILVDHLKAAVRDPGIGSFALVTGVITGLALAALVLRAWLNKLQKQPEKSSG